MANNEIVKILKEIAAYLEMESIEFKPRAYEKAAYAIEGLEENLNDIYKKGGLKELMKIPGIGRSIGEKIEEALKKGKVEYLEDFRKKYPIDLYELIAVEGIGPKLAKKLYQEFGVKNIESLEKLALQGKIKNHPHFTEKSEQKLLKAIEFYKKSKGRFMLGHVMTLVESIKEKLKKMSIVQKIEICGSYRRREDTIGDIDILVVSKKPEELIEYFTKIPEVININSKGISKTSVKLSNGLNVDLRIVKNDSWGSALQYFTGNKDHNVELRILAEHQGYKLNEYGLFKINDKKLIKVAGSKEKDIYEKLGLEYIEPELRTNWGELKLAKNHKLPNIIKYNSIKGDLQTQTKYSDGQESIESMTKAAIKLGLEYVAITDHSKSLGVAHGLKEKDLFKQFKEINKLNLKFRKQKLNFTILKSSEVNILKDGSLDWPDEILKQMDIVLGAIHDNFNLPESEQTNRMIKAMNNNYIDIIVHPTGRLIQKRPAYKIDMSKILQAAARTKTLMEINSFPDRLDLNTEHARLAKSLGVKFVINTDAHHSNHFAFLDLGVAVARRAGLEKKDVLNTLPLDEFLRSLPKKNKKITPYISIEKTPLKSKTLIKEQSAGIIVFYKDEKELLFLVLHYPKMGHRANVGKSGHFDFPKGHIEKGENDIETATRETEEETGLKLVKILEGFKEKINYFYKFENKNYFKEVYFFIGESFSKDVKISDEHLGYEWLSYKDALHKLTYNNAKNMLKKSFRFLKNNNYINNYHED